MRGLPESISSLIKELSKMPGVGHRSAQRMAFFILTRPKEEVKALADALIKVKEKVTFCKTCFNLSDKDTCDICSNDSRDRTCICVVENPNDVTQIEKMGNFNGAYHVLLGALSPIDGVTPKDLKIEELIKRIKKEKAKEVIIATDANTEGEATAFYLARALKPLGARITRLAYGIPVGASLEYADQATLYKAFEGRRDI